jgi:hypothetical protein
MASLKDAQRLTEELRNQAEELHTQVVDGDVDLSTIVRLADELGGAADRAAATFDKVNDALERAEDGGDEEEQEPASGRPLTAALAPGSREEKGPEPEPAVPEPAVPEPAVPTSREELYARAGKANIEIPGEPEVSNDEPT